MDELIHWAASNGVPIGVLAVLVALVTLAQLFPRILGPISQTIYDFAKVRRQAAREREDADISELRRQVAHLSTTNKQKDHRIELLERHIWQHRNWEQSAMDALPGDYKPPPATFPTDDGGRGEHP